MIECVCACVAACVEHMSPSVNKCLSYRLGDNDRNYGDRLINYGLKFIRRADANIFIAKNFFVHFNDLYTNLENTACAVSHKSYKFCL